MVKRSIMVLCLVMLCTLLSYAEECADCHTGVVSEHHGAGCTDCHKENEKHYSSAGTLSGGGCQSCHNKYENMSTHGKYLSNHAEKFIETAFGEYDNRFAEENCSGCHVGSCADCHGSHEVKRPDVEACLRCHNDHAVGADYTGYAPRPQAQKYQRGKDIEGKHYLKMVPDVHFEAGMGCGDCHSMQSIADGQTASETCTDCHTPDKRIAEHTNHDRLECASCHAGWSYGEYGTFYMQFVSSRKHYKSYAAKLEPVGDSYVRSAVLHEYDATVLGVGKDEKISPIRPFITYYTLFEDGEAVIENRQVSSMWDTFAPHTIRRGVRGCESCHDSDKRLMNLKNDNVYNLRDSLGISSFWNKDEMSMTEGRFLSDEEINDIKHKDIPYKKQQVERWQRIIKKLD